MNNIPADIEALRYKEAVLLGHCAVGRDPETIEGTTSIGSLFIRDDPDEAERVSVAAFQRNRASPYRVVHGTQSKSPISWRLTWPSAIDI